jgi:hypothetical protein
MGGDGGQVIDRGTMVKTKGWGFTKNAGGGYANSLGEMANYVQAISEDTGMTVLERRRFRMTTCKISQDLLQEPVVACRLGNLYNKEALIGALLNKSVPSACDHVRALKDVKQCLLTWAEDAEGKEGISSGHLETTVGSRSGRRMVCPVTREDLDAGGSHAVLIWTSGAVISAKALSELKMKECPLTGKAFDKDKDVIPLAASGDELQKLRDKLPATKKRKAVEEPGPLAAPVPTTPALSSLITEQKPKDKKALERAAKVAKSGVLDALLEKDGPEAWRKKRDPFGTPAYNRGAHL